MTLDQIRYFIAAAHFEHVGKAAHASAISPSAISHAVASLERELGCLLFERRSKKLYLTHEGRAFQSRGQLLLAQVSGMRAAITGTSPELEGVLRLGGSHFLAPRLLAPAWSMLAAAHPKLSAELSSMRTSQLLADLVAGGLDAGVCFSPLQHPELKLKTVARGPLRLAVRKNHPALKKSKPWEALAEYPAAFYKPSAGIDLCETHPALLRLGLRPTVRSYFDSDEIAVTLLSHSDSWALLPAPVIQQAGRLLTQLKTGPGFNPHFEIALACRTDSERAPWYQALAAALKSNYSG